MDISFIPLAPFVMVIFIVWFVSLRQQDRNRAESRKTC
jgi:preprotein translocase subunit YajC